MSGARIAEAWARYTPTDRLDRDDLLHRPALARLHHDRLDLDDLRQRLHHYAEASTPSSRIRPKSAPKSTGSRSGRVLRNFRGSEWEHWALDNYKPPARLGDVQSDEHDDSQDLLRGGRDASPNSARNEHGTEHIDACSDFQSAFKYDPCFKSCMLCTPKHSSDGAQTPSRTCSYFYSIQMTDSNSSGISQIGGYLLRHLGCSWRLSDNTCSVRMLMLIW